MRKTEQLAFSNRGENYRQGGWRGGHGLRFLNVRRRHGRLWNRGSHFHSERIVQAVVVKINYMVRRTGGRYQLGSFLGNSAETSYLTKTRERQMEVV